MWRHLKCVGMSSLGRQQLHVQGKLELEFEAIPLFEVDPGAICEPVTGVEPEPKGPSKIILPVIQPLETERATVWDILSTTAGPSVYPAVRPQDKTLLTFPWLRDRRWNWPQ